jgi:glucokinase
VSIEAILGVDVGGTLTSAGLVTRDGALVAQAEAPTRRGGPGSALPTLFGLVDDLLAVARSEGYSVLGIGAGVPGAVDADRGVIGEDIQNLPELARVPLGDRLAERSRLITFVDNDVNTLALGEWYFGAGRGVSSLVVLAVGTGVGGGIVLDGHLVRGAGGYGGELGHVPIDLNGRPCFCGGHGCLKTYVSGPDIAAEARERVKGEPYSRMLALAAGDPAALTATHVFQAAREGDPQASALVDEVCHALGAGLAMIVNGLNPDLLLLTGGVVESLQSCEATILGWVRRHAFAGALATTRIRWVPRDKRATVRGGAALYLYETARLKKGDPAGSALP